MKFGKYSALVLVLLLNIGCKNASSPNFPEITNAPLPETYFQQTRQNIEGNPERTIRNLQNYFNRLAVEDKVSVEKLQSIANLKMAETRSKILTDFMMLDEDGSGHLSINETLLLSNKQRYTWYDPNSDFISTKEIDTNGDGQLSFQEIYSFARKAALLPNKRTHAPETELNVFNTNKDKYITLDELEVGLEELLHKSSRQNIIKPTTASKEPVYKKPPEECIAQPPSKSAQVIFLSGRYGAAVPNLSLTGQNVETQAVKVTIEAGNESLYVVATAYRPIIWSFSGSTQRVEQFVVSPAAQKDAEVVGVAGLKKSQVAIIGKGCLPLFSRPSDASGFVAKAKWGQLIKQQPDVMFGSDTLRAVSLPKGGIDTSYLNDWKPNNPAFTHEEKLRYVFEKTKSDGILNLKKKDITSSVPAELYNLLPGDAGLIQLIDEGALEMVDHKTYRIAKPIEHLPAPVSRPSTNAFVLSKGIPIPKDLTGNIRIYDEETGDCLYGRRCISR